MRPAHGTPDARTKEIVIELRAGSGKQLRNVLFRCEAEIACDIKARERGLSGRERLAANRGMLFILDEGKPGAFWMKGMKFPLDLLYFDRHRRLIGILHRLQPCDTCPEYPTPGDASYVLEVNGGTAEKYGITTGAAFSFASSPATDGLGGSICPQPRSAPGHPEFLRKR